MNVYDYKMEIEKTNVEQKEPLEFKILLTKSEARDLLNNYERLKNSDETTTFLFDVLARKLKTFGLEQW